MLRVRLDRIYFVETENWKHYSKIIFKYVNSSVRSIFNKKIAEKWNLWVSCTVYRTHRIDKGAKKSTNYGYCSWTVAIVPTTEKEKEKRKKKKKNANMKRNLWIQTAPKSNNSWQVFSKKKKLMTSKFYLGFICNDKFRILYRLNNYKC